MPATGRLLAPLPRRRLWRLAAGMLTVLVLCGGSGCVVFDGTLKEDGSGTFQLTYGMLPNATPESERARFSSPHVTLESVRIADGKVNVKGTVDDATKLSTAPFFRAVTITRAHAGNDHRLRVVISNPKGLDVKDEGKEGPTIGVTVPGRVLEASQPNEIAGDHVMWKWKLAEFVRQPSIPLWVRYVPATPPAASEKGPQVPEPAKPAPGAASPTPEH